MNFRLKRSVCFFCICLFSFNVFAGPWLLPGSLSVKSDIDLLADASLIKAPVMTWPIAWVNIGPELLSSKTKAKLPTEPEAVQQAYQRIVALYQQSYQPHKVQTAAYASGSNRLNPFRTFQYEPYADFASGVSAAYQSKHAAGSINVSYYNAPNQSYSNPAHLDNSYAYLLLGNWAIGFDQFNRWWGPGYSDSLILSQNAEPLPAFTIQRMDAEAFQTKWLHWIGPWSLTSSLSSQFDGGAPHNQNAFIWLTNITIRPIQSLQLGLSQVSMFAGDARPLSRAMFRNLFRPPDGCYGNQSYYGNMTCQDEPGKDHVETSAQWSLDPEFSVPVDLYVQFAYDDAASISHSWGNYISAPAKAIFLGGADWLTNINAGQLKTYFEYENTQIYNFPFFTGGTYNSPFDFYNGNPNYPYTYYGSILGSSLGNEAIAETLGFILNENDENSDTVTLRYLRLNMYNGITPAYIFQKQDLIWGSFGRTVALPHRIGWLTSEIGYLQSVAGSGLSSGFSATLTWSKSF